MPQIRLETSRRLASVAPVRRLFADLHEMLVGTVNASLEACKSRLVVIEEVHISDGKPGQDMAHLEIKLLAGRTPEVKTAAGDKALAMMEAAFGPYTADGKVNISVEIVDMNPATYFKKVLA